MVFLKTYGVLQTSYVDVVSVEDLHKLELPSGASFYKNGKKLEEDAVLSNNDTIEVVFGLLGGKGGFGSMLRAMGNQIQKTNNKEAMRDLSGRRIRDINEEKRLKDYVSKKAERERIQAEKKEAKLKKLQKLVVEGEKSKHEFHDEKYNEAREAATERVHEAMKQVYDNIDSKPGTSGIKRKASEEETKSESSSKSEEKPGPSSAKKGLWIGADLNESDFEDSSDEEEETPSAGSGSA